MKPWSRYSIQLWFLFYLRIEAICLIGQPKRGPARLTKNVETFAFMKSFDFENADPRSRNLHHKELLCEPPLPIPSFVSLVVLRRARTGIIAREQTYGDFRDRRKPTKMCNNLEIHMLFLMHSLSISPLSMICDWYARFYLVFSHCKSRICKWLPYAKQYPTHSLEHKNTAFPYLSTL